MGASWRTTMVTLNIKSFPDGLCRRLRRRAKERHRSTAQEVTHLLSAPLDEPEALSILELRGLERAPWEGIDPAHHVEGERGSWD